MARTIIEIQKASARNRENSFLGSSIAKLSGFGICRMVGKGFLKVPLVKRKTLKEIFCFKKTR